LKIYGSKETDSEIDFEEQPRTVASSQHNDDYAEKRDNYLFAETIEEEEVLRLEQKKSK
jgi:hypothetical protein